MLGLLAGCGDGAWPLAPPRGDRTATVPRLGQETRKDSASPDAKDSSGAKGVMALVNGKPIYMAELIDSLLRGPGRSYADQVVRQELVRQALAKAGLALTDDDIEAETQTILKLMVLQTRTRAERMQVLERMLVQKQVPREQWLAGVRVAASLRKLAEPRVKIDDEMLRIEFGQVYGRQAVVRAIEVESLTKVREVLAALKAGEDFAQLAWKESKHPSASNHGLLDPMSASSRNVPPAILQTALSLRKVGQISDPVQVEATFFILKLEESIEPKNVKFEDVKDKITVSLRARLLRMHQKAVLDEITSAGKVEFVNPILKSRPPTNTTP